MNPIKTAGALLFLGGVESIIGIMLAESQYPNPPGYSIANNPISDLGATCRAGTCVIYRGSAVIFDSSVILLGILVIAGAYLLNRGGYKPLPILIALSGVGAIGVGIFPETTGVLHTIMSLIVFLFGGLSAAVSYKHSKSPMSYLSLILGVITLVALVLYASGTYLGLGQGGMERVIAYPALVWATGFGGYLMGRQDQTAAPTP